MPTKYATEAPNKSINWFAKPNELSPVECSLLGWINIEKNLLYCNSCKQQIYIPEIQLSGNNTTHDINRINLLINKYQTKLNKAHKKCCPWFNNPSPKR